MIPNIAHLNALWINYHRYGQPTDLPPLICMHGVTGNAWLWHEVAQALSAKRQVIAMDFRGHGDSEWCPEKTYTTDDHLNDLMALIKHLNVDKVSLAGMSWGGLVAIKAAAKFPEQIHSLTVVDVEASFSQGVSDVAPRPESFSSVAELHAWERNANKAAPEALLRQFAYYSVSQQGDGVFTRKHDPYFFEQWPFRADNVWSDLSNIHTPTLFVHGERSFVKKEVMEKMQDTTPGAQSLIGISDAGHIVGLEQPAKLAEAISNFLD